MKVYMIGSDSPEEGHTFQFQMSTRMSSGTLDDPQRRDADSFMEAPNVVRVRAWNMVDAIRKVAHHDRVLVAFLDEHAGMEVEE